MGDEGEARKGIMGWLDSFVNARAEGSTSVAAMVQMFEETANARDAGTDTSGGVGTSVAAMFDDFVSMVLANDRNLEQEQERERYSCACHTFVNFVKQLPPSLHEMRCG